MSISARTVIYCDSCEDLVLSFDGDETDAEHDFTHYRDGSIGVEIDGDYFGHVCYGCMDDLVWCDWCEQGYSSEAWYCDGTGLGSSHEECIEEYHLDLRSRSLENGILTPRECDCGYEYDSGFDAGFLKKPIIKLEYAR